MLAGVAVAGAAVAVEGQQFELAPKVVTSWPRRRQGRRQRQRFPAVASVVVAVGRLLETVTTRRPAVWLNTTRAFRPFARQRSYSAEKSVVETAGCGVGQAGPSTLVHTPPLTTLVHVAVGETRKVGGRGGVYDGWHPAGPAGPPTTPEEGEAGQAWQVDYHPAGLLPPHPRRGRGGETVGGAGVRVQEESSSPDEG